MYAIALRMLMMDKIPYNEELEAEIKEWYQILLSKYEVDDE
jgi:hypothetical protein